MKSGTDETDQKRATEQEKKREKGKDMENGNINGKRQRQRPSFIKLQLFLAKNLKKTQTVR